MTEGVTGKVRVSNTQNSLPNFILPATATPYQIPPLTLSKQANNMAIRCQRRSLVGSRVVYIAIRLNSIRFVCILKIRAENPRFVLILGKLSFY